MNKESKLAKIAYILMIVSTVLSSFLIITLAWMIPMTLAVKKRVNEYSDSLVLGICCLLFTGTFGFVSGILLLVNKQESYDEIDNTSVEQNVN